jgi:hypothetical protein
MKHIIPINEFDSGVFGDTYGYGGANGVMKINYKPFSDLSIEVGQDPNMKTDVDGSEFKIGDTVVAQKLKSKKEVIGTIVRSFRNPDNQQYRYFVQVYNKGKETEKVVEVKSDSIRFAEGGQHGNMQQKAKIQNNKAVDKAYNSQTVYSSSDLGIETTGG